MVERSCIVVAAGRGERMRREEPKAFLRLAGWPLYVHAVRAFATAQVGQLVAVVPEERVEEARDWLDKLPDWPGEEVGYWPEVTVVSGGAHRADSVRSGLAACTGDHVAVHDAARPLVSADLIRRTFDALEPPWVAVAPALRVADTLKLVQGARVVKTLPRTDVWAVQTPQVFWRSVLVQAHADGDDASDDLGLVERLGKPVRLIHGEPRNFKVTYPSDFAMAEELLG